jgi:hypothetical protein
VATAGNLTRQLAAIADSLGPLLMPVDQRNQLNDLCSMTRLAIGAGSVSVARLEGSVLVYEAADGLSADEVVGMRLPSDRGIAGYVASTGMSLVVDEAGADPRFARDIAERIGYVPDSLMAVPIIDGNGGVLGVVSILDRTVGIGDPLAIASAAARVAAPALAMFGAVVRLGPLLVRAVADAVDANETTLVRALRRMADDLPVEDAEIASFASLLAAVRTLPPGTRETVAGILRDSITLATPRRRW